MNIYLTFDYELYFGNKTGSVSRCITEPTRLLMEVAEKHQIRLCQFVDIGFLIRLEAEMKRFPSLASDHSLICSQLELLWKNGHDLQLHIHPHWEDSFYDGEKWVCNVQRYKLADFSQADISDIVSRYKKRLEGFTGSSEVFAYRAGGWCVQPFKKLQHALKQEGIKVDSSVFKEGHYRSDLYQYDFRNAPDLSSWKFNEDPLQPSENGDFTEIPIASIRQSPLFFWKLFLLGRINPGFHKPLGDGVPVSSPGYRKRILTRFTNNTVSLDGYNAKHLQKALNQHIKKEMKEMVVIGHPKALSMFGLKTLESFIASNSMKHHFTTFREQKSQFV